MSVQEFSKRFINSIIISEIKNTDVSHVKFWSSIVVGEEIEVICGILIVAIVNINDGVCLIPCTNISELMRNNSHRRQIGIIVVDLIYWIGPSISNTYTLQSYIVLLQERGIV